MKLTKIMSRTKPLKGWNEFFHKYTSDRDMAFANKARLQREVDMKQENLDECVREVTERWPEYVSWTWTVEVIPLITTLLLEEMKRRGIQEFKIPEKWGKIWSLFVAYENLGEVPMRIYGKDVQSIGKFANGLEAHLRDINGSSFYQATNCQVTGRAVKDVTIGSRFMRRAEDCSVDVDTLHAYSLGDAKRVRVKSKEIGDNIGINGEQLRIEGEKAGKCLLMGASNSEASLVTAGDWAGAFSRNTTINLKSGGNYALYRSLKSSISARRLGAYLGCLAVKPQLNYHKVGPNSLKYADGQWLVVSGGRNFSFLDLIFKIDRMTKYTGPRAEGASYFDDYAASSSRYSKLDFVNFLPRQQLDINGVLSFLKAMIKDSLISYPLYDRDLRGTCSEGDWEKPIDTESRVLLLAFARELAPTSYDVSTLFREELTLYRNSPRTLQHLFKLPDSPVGQGPLYFARYDYKTPPQKVTSEEMNALLNHFGVK